MIIRQLSLSTALVGGLLVSPLIQAADEISIADDSRTRLDLTLYQQNLALVQEQRKVPALPADTPILLQAVSPQMQAQTLKLRGMGQILEQNLEQDLLSLGSLLQTQMGKTITLARFNPVTGSETRTEVRLLRVEGNTALIANEAGEIETLPLHQGQWRLIVKPDSPNYQLQPRLSFRTKGTRNAAEAEISYLTQGLSWQMDYLLTLDSAGEQLDLEGLATLNNHSGLAWPQANIKLLAGQVNQPQQTRPEVMLMRSAVADMKGSGVETGSVQDYHLYTLPGLHNLQDQQQKQVPLIPNTQLPASIQYTYALQVNAHQQMPPQLDQALTELHFTAPATSGSRLPLPSGQARVFRPDADGQLQFVGGTQVPATAAGEKVRVVMGEAFDLGIEQVQTGFRKVFEGYEVEYRISVRNRSEQSKPLDLTAHFPLPFKLTLTSKPTTQVSGASASWQMEIPAESEEELSFSATLTTR
jgi:hypothetical protein